MTESNDNWALAFITGDRIFRGAPGQRECGASMDRAAAGGPNCNISYTSLERLRASREAVVAPPSIVVGTSRQAVPRSMTKAHGPLLLKEMTHSETLPCAASSI